MKTDNDEPPTCLRCKQLYTIECGYEATKHNYCWACCSDLVENLMLSPEDEEDLASLRREISLRVARAEAHRKNLGGDSELDKESFAEEKRWLALLLRLEPFLPKET